MNLESFPVLGIALAVLSAAALSLGNLLQSRGVASGTPPPSRGLRAGDLLALLGNREWLVGAAFLVIAILLQLGSLTFAPLIVVQPVGVIALVFAALLTARTVHRPPGRREILAIAVCVLSVAAFVTIAALVSVQATIGRGQLLAVLAVLAVLLLVSGGVLAVRRGRRTPPVMVVIVGGIFSGFVATLGKTLILRVQSSVAEDDFSIDQANLLTALCLLGVAVAGAVSVYCTQTAHTSNRPEVVVAGLTVVDPFVAVVLGITILGEASQAPWWAFPCFAVAGACAMWGVVALSRQEQQQLTEE